jgi:hypothetical protein
MEGRETGHIHVHSPRAANGGLVQNELQLMRNKSAAIPDHMLQNETVGNCHVKLSPCERRVEQLPTHMNTGWKKQDTHPCFHDMCMTMLGELCCV